MVQFVAVIIVKAHGGIYSSHLRNQSNWDQLELKYVHDRVPYEVKKSVNYGVIET